MGKKALQYPDENFIYYKYINYTEGMAHSSTNTSAPKDRYDVLGPELIA